LVFGVNAAAFAYDFPQLIQPEYDVAQFFLRKSGLNLDVVETDAVLVVLDNLQDRVRSGAGHRFAGRPGARVAPSLAFQRIHEQTFDAVKARIEALDILPGWDVVCVHEELNHSVEANRFSFFSGHLASRMYSAMECELV
jgi:hypothetical protein